jgi:4-amino-4-deoxy-L-arabinose transferase-like glycosyltransferase
MDGCHRQATTTPWSLSLISPAYNEERAIRAAVQEADRALAGLMRDYEILVVDDGSSDGTARVVAEAARHSPHIHLLRHAENCGYGAALRTGFAAARCERVAFTDADCQFHLDDLAPLLALTEHVPLAVGYRSQRRDPWQRRFFSWGYNLLVRTLLGTRVRDCDCALKVFRKEALWNLLPQSDGFFVNTEMLTRARQLGYEIAEAPVRHRARLFGKSKVSLWDIPRTLRTLLPFWWSRALFPLEAGTQPQGARSAERSAPAGAPYAVLLILVSALLFFSRLGCPLQEPEEPRYAEIPRQMLSSGSFATPVLHGLPYYDKPPLLYWLIMGSYVAFGVSDSAARLVPCAAAFLTVLVTYLWGRRVAGARAAFAAAMMLTLSARFVYLGRLLTMNSLLCLWVIVALAAAHIALRGPTLRRGWWLVSAAACGLGMLTKGPVALVLVCVPMLLYQLLDTRTARPMVRSWLAYQGAAFLLSGPWYLLTAARDPDFAGYFLWKHNVVRYILPFDHQKPIAYYLSDVLLGMLPWSLLLLPFARYLGRHFKPAIIQRPAALGFFLLASIWCFVFYSLAGSKRSGYILPAMPPLALALGCYLDAWLSASDLRTAAPLSSSRFAFRSTLAVFGLASAASMLAASAGLVSSSIAIFLAGAGVLALVAVYRIGDNVTPATAWSVCGSATFTVLFLSLQLVLPSYAGRFSLRVQIRPYARLCQDPKIPVVCYPRRWDSVSFYLRRDDVQVYTPDRRQQLITDLRANPKTLAFIKSDHSLNDLLRALPGSMEFAPRGQQGGVTVGWIRPRFEVPATLFAGRSD